MAACTVCLQWPIVKDSGGQKSSKSTHHLDGVTLDCNNALNEDIVVQARKGCDGLEDTVAENRAQDRVARLVGLPKNGFVWVEDDDVPSYRLPAWVQPFIKASKRRVPCTRPRSRIQKVQRKGYAEPNIEAQPSCS